MSWLQVKDGHHQLNGHEFDSEGQGSLVYCSSWGRKQSAMTLQLNTLPTGKTNREAGNSFRFILFPQIKLNRWRGYLLIKPQQAPRGLGRPQNNLRSPVIKHKAEPQEIEKASHPQLNASTQVHSWLLITFPPFGQSEPCSLYLGGNSPKLYCLTYFSQEWTVALYFTWEGYSIWWQFQLCGSSSRSYKI